jgi:hypothetical protein
MQIRQILEEDFEPITDWFIDQPWPLPVVPNGMSKFGFVVADDDSDIACGYVYFTETGYAFLDWIGLNPKRNFEEHKKACLFLTDKIEGLLKNAIKDPVSKVSCIVLYTRIQWLADALKENQWRSTRNFIQCTKVLK